MKKENAVVKTIDNEEIEYVKKYYKIDFSKMARMIISDLDDTSATTILFKTFPKERVIDALQNPQKNESLLRNVSNFLYILSPHYKRLCNYYADMATLDYYIEPYRLDVDKVNIKQFKKAYNTALDKIENMNIKHEMGKILQVVYREGIFYGYEHETEDSYFIQRLNPDNCRFRVIEDGVFNIEFDFSYFEMDESKLDNYAPEFTTKYNNYKNSQKRRNKDKKEDLQWQELDSSRTIVVKTDETVPYSFPPFAGVLPDIYEIQDYKALKKANNEMQNYAILSGNVPMNKNSDMGNDFKVELGTAIEFGNQINQELPDQVGFILSIFEDMKLFRLNDDKVGTDKVEEATNNFWSASGVSKNLFTDSGNTDAAMEYSVTADEQSLFSVLRQIERWINRKMKQWDGKYKFKINMLNTTWYNQSSMISQELKSAQFGTPNKIRLMATMGVSQKSMESMEFLENNVLELHDKWIPLSSSHTQNSNANSPTGGEAGRVSKEEDKIRTDGVE